MTSAAVVIGALRVTVMLLLHSFHSFAENESPYSNITKTRLFKYTKNFTTKKMKIFRGKILIFFIFLLKT